MLKNKKLLYQGILLIAAFAIATPLHAAWYDSIRAAAAQLYSQAKALFYTEPLQEIANRVRISIPLNKQLQSVLQEIEDHSSGTLGQWQEVKSLIEQGADVNTVTQKTGNSALHLALSDPNHELIKKLDIISFLNQHKADYNKENNMGYTAQDIQKQSQKFQSIIQTEPAAEQQKLSSPPETTLAAQTSDQLNKRLKLELNRLEFETVKTQLLLHWDSIMDLINKGADINLQNSNGNTALHLAVLKENAGKVYTLLGYTRGMNKINTKILNNNKQTPYDIARSLENEMITNMLSAHYLPYEL